MRVALSSDHAGFDLKEQVKRFVQDQGHEVQDYGTYDDAPVDYPDFAEKVGLALRKVEADRGIVICGSGVGASVAANKLPGIRAGICHDTYSAHQGVEHDDMNVLVLGARIVGIELARELVRTYLEARFTGEERHQRRLEKINSLETRHGSRARVPPGTMRPEIFSALRDRKNTFTRSFGAGGHFPAASDGQAVPERLASFV